MFYPCPAILPIHCPQAHRISFLLCRVLAPIPNNSKQRVSRVICFGRFQSWHKTNRRRSAPLSFTSSPTTTILPLRHTPSRRTTLRLWLRCMNTHLADGHRRRHTLATHPTRSIRLSVGNSSGHTLLFVHSLGQAMIISYSSTALSGRHRSYIPQSNLSRRARFQTRHRRAHLPQTSHWRTSKKDCLSPFCVENAVIVKTTVCAPFWRTNQSTTKTPHRIRDAFAGSWLDSVSPR